jgi:diguanylate cyclase (GGDEF)-like protein
MEDDLDRTAPLMALPDSLADDEVRSEAHLIVIFGTHVGEMIKIGERLVIGRGSQADFRVDDSGVSKAHLCIFKREDGSVAVRDLGSRNGTCVNNQPITAETILQDGDKIHFGSTTVLKFSLADTLEKTFQQRMYEAALIDPLTGLRNRRHFMEHLETEFSFAARHRSPLSLVMFDIDRFKDLNDAHGHLVGDEVLRSIAGQLMRATRKEDLAARYGGEELALICRQAPVERAFALAERIRRTIETARLLESQPHRSVTVSAGVAGVPHPKIDDPQALIRAADEALYAAKHAGRNCVRRFTG